MFHVRLCDNIDVYFVDFQADEDFARRCITFVKKAAPPSHREHITAVSVAPVGKEKFNISYEVFLDAGTGIPKVNVDELKPYHKKAKRATNSTDANSTLQD